MNEIRKIIDIVENKFVIDQKQVDLLVGNASQQIQKVFDSVFSGHSLLVSQNKGHKFPFVKLSFLIDMPVFLTWQEIKHIEEKLKSNVDNITKVFLTNTHDNHSGILFDVFLDFSLEILKKNQKNI